MVFLPRLSIQEITAISLVSNLYSRSLARGIVCISLLILFRHRNNVALARMLFWISFWLPGACTRSLTLMGAQILSFPVLLIPR